MNRALLALTVGDPAGIGPEIVLRLLTEGDLPARLLVVGDRAALERARPFVPGSRIPPVVPTPEAARAREEPTLLWEPHPPLEVLPPWGQIDAAAGAASYAWVRAAAHLALEGHVDGVVTGPIHKEAWRRSGIAFPGHTEALREAAGTRHVLMLLVGGRLRTALATIHVPLRQVPTLLSTPDLVEDLLLLDREIARFFGPTRPRIAVTGLNPHAGEGGLFGREEERVIAPAVATARSRGVDAHGPLPADACIPAALTGRWDAVLAMYHDQALPAVKAIAPRRGVNMTLGLPFVRTSVDHGTAFDIAGQGQATCSSLLEAVRLAAEVLGRVGEESPRSRNVLNARDASSDLV